MVCKNAAHKYWLSLKLGFCKKKKVVLLYLFLMTSILRKINLFTEQKCIHLPVTVAM